MTSTQVFAQQRLDSSSLQLLIVEAIIDTEGRVTDLRVLKGLHPSFDDTAIAAIRQWRFKPATLQGKPVPVIYNLTIIATEK